VSNLEYYQRALKSLQQDYAKYKQLLKTANGIIKRINDSGDIDAVELKAQKDDAKRYREFIADLKKTIRELEEKMVREVEPGKMGRPSIGTARAVKITLPDEDWAHIDRLVASKRVSSVAEYFRSLHDSSLSDFLLVE
jgi:hypothetical protein